MKNSVHQKKFIQMPVLIAIIAGVIIIGGAGTTYAFAEYENISDKITRSDWLSNEENHTEAIELLELAQKNWLVKALGVKDAVIKNKLYEIEVRKQHQSVYRQALNKAEEREWQGAITILSEIPENSFYRRDAQLKIEEAKREILEEELAAERTARQAAELVAEQEEQARKTAEAKARNEAARRAEEEVARKQAEQKAALEESRRQEEARARAAAEARVESERLAKEQQQRETQLQRHRAEQEEKARILELAKTHPLIKAIVSGELKFYIDPLPSYAAAGVSGAVEDTARDFSSWNPYGASVRRVYNSNDADLTISWVRDYGSHTIGQAIYRAHIKVGLGSNNCVGVWSAFDASTITKILWHELGHSMGYGHSTNPNNVMYSQTDTRFEIDHEISEVIPGGWYYTFPLCGGGAYSYSFQTDNPYTGFNLFVLPPGVDPKSISDGSGNVYVGCGKAEMQSYSGSCTVAGGAQIYIGNISYQDAIRLSGEIIDMNYPVWPDMTWDQNAFRYDSNQLMEYWELFH